MRRSYILGSALAASLLAGASAHAALLEQYEFQGQPGTETSVAPASVATGLSGINFGEVGVQPSSGANSINSTGWNIAGAAYTFGFTVQAGYTATVNQLVLSTRSSGTGPGSISVQASVNGGAYATVASITQSETNYNDEMLALTAPVTGITSGVNFRLVAANQTAAGGGTIGSAGTFRVGDYNPSGTPTPFSVNGTVSALATTVPEPGTVLLVACALGLFGARRFLT